MMVLNSVLGGGVSSRLFTNIREKRGLAYSIGSHHHLFAETGDWSVGVNAHRSFSDRWLFLSRRSERS